MKKFYYLITLVIFLGCEIQDEQQDPAWCGLRVYAEDALLPKKQFVVRHGHVARFHVGVRERIAAPLKIEAPSGLIIRSELLDEEIGLISKQIYSRVYLMTVLPQDSAVTGKFLIKLSYPHKITLLERWRTSTTQLIIYVE